MRILNYAVLLALVLGVGCGKKGDTLVKKPEPTAPVKEPELSTEKVITPGEAANKLFVEATKLISQAQAKEDIDIKGPSQITRRL